MNSVKEQLEAELNEAQQKKEELDQQLAQKPEFGLGQGSTGAHLWEMNLARKENIEAEIEALEAALSRVNEGTYGRCEKCGRQIDPERLEILPTTTLCADCA